MSKRINKEIFSLALPSILANITVPLVGMVDIAVAGHLGASSVAAIGGISVGTLMFDVLYWNFGFLRAGTGGLTSQAYGKGDWECCSQMLLRGVGSAFALALAILLLQWPFQKLFFLFVNCSDEVKALAVKYFLIRVTCAPATLSLMAFRGWFIGMQDTVSAMATDLVVNGVNVLASIVLAMGVPSLGFHGMGFPGVALGTVVAQYTGLVMALLIVVRKYSRTIRISVDRKSLAAAFEGGAMKRFVSVNTDLFVRSVCLIAVYLGFTAVSARFGDTLLATCSIMMKLLMIFSYFTDGFAFAGEAMTGKYIGMKNTAMVRSTVRWTFGWSMGIGLFFVGIYSFTGMPLFRLMTDEASVIASASAFIPWLVLIPLVGCPAFTWDGIYTGATATREMRDSNIGCVIVFFGTWFLGAALLRPEGNAQVHLLFVAYYAHLVWRSVYQTVKYRPAVLRRLS